MGQAARSKWLQRAPQTPTSPQQGEVAARSAAGEGAEHSRSSEPPHPNPLPCGETERAEFAARSSTSITEPLAKNQPAPPREPWRRRLVRTLLYGNGDRAAKARARIGLALLMFALGYGVIAARLIMFATAADGHSARRIAHDAVATARPDILDRNGEILAIDVRTPSLFAEPQRIIDVD